MPVSVGKFFIGSDNRIEIAGLVDEHGVYLDGRAVVVASLKTTNGADVENGGGLEFQYVPNSNGDFVGYIPANAVLRKGRRYVLEIVAQNDAVTLTVNVEREAGYVTA